MECRFFQTEPWKTVPQDKAGIYALKARLNKYLVDLARQNFGEVGQDIARNIDNCHKRLQALGPDKANKSEQRNCLLKISTAFQSLTAHALDAYYARDQCFVTHEELRLATIIKNLQEEFSTTMRKEGHNRKFSKRVKNGRTADSNTSAPKLKEDSNYPAGVESSSSGSGADEAALKVFLQHLPRLSVQNC